MPVKCPCCGSKEKFVYRSAGQRNIFSCPRCDRRIRISNPVIASFLLGQGFAVSYLALLYLLFEFLAFHTNLLTLMMLALVLMIVVIIPSRAVLYRIYRWECEDGPREQGNHIL
jgi:hypothetical protein